MSGELKESGRHHKVEVKAQSSGEDLLLEQADMMAQRKGINLDRFILRKLEELIEGEGSAE